MERRIGTRGPVVGWLAAVAVVAGIAFWADSKGAAPAPRAVRPSPHVVRARAERPEPPVETDDPEDEVAAVAPAPVPHFTNPFDDLYDDALAGRASK